VKVCKCGVSGRINFYKNRSRPDGLSFDCVVCIAKQRKAEYHKKYPNGKGPKGAGKGNQNALKHGRYAGGGRKAKKKLLPNETRLRFTMAQKREHAIQNT